MTDTVSALPPVTYANSWYPAGTSRRLRLHVVAKTRTPTSAAVMGTALRGWVDVIRAIERKHARADCVLRAHSGAGPLRSAGFRPSGRQTDRGRWTACHQRARGPGRNALRGSTHQHRPRLQLETAA